MFTAGICEVSRTWLSGRQDETAALMSILAQPQKGSAPHTLQLSTKAKENELLQGTD